MKSLSSTLGRQNRWASNKTTSSKKASAKPNREVAAAGGPAVGHDERFDAPPRDDSGEKAATQPKSALKQALRAPHTAGTTAPKRATSRVRFAETHQERIITKGVEELKQNFSNSPENAKKVRLYEAAQKANLPVAAKDGTMMVWPSGQAYTGPFDKAGLPGPQGTVTLADGRKFLSFWQHGKCYRVSDPTQQVTAAQIETVGRFKTKK